MKQKAPVIYVWFAENDGAERNGEQFIRAWTHDPARVDGLRNAIGKEPTIYSAILQAATSDAPSADAVDAHAEIERLNAIINTPQSDDFIRAVSIEAEHQRQRWGSEGDAGKTPADWFWLVGYLAGKALHSHAAGNVEKGEHHIITTAAACANWHRNLFGKTDMRPGIAPKGDGND